MTPEQKAAALAAAKAARKAKSEAEPASAAGGAAVATLESGAAEAAPGGSEPTDARARAQAKAAALAAAKAAVRAKAGAVEATQRAEAAEAEASGASEAAPGGSEPTDARARAQAKAAALAAAKAKAAGKTPAAKKPAPAVAAAAAAASAPKPTKRMSAKMALSVIVFVMAILISSGAFVIKLLVWNDYNSATQLEKAYRANIEKLKTHPEDLKVRYELLGAMYRKGQHDAARLQLQYIGEHAAPDSELLIKSLYYKGLYLSMDNAYEEALAAYDRFLQSYPDSGEALVNVAYVYYSLGRYEEAGMAVGKAGVFLPQSPEVPCLFGMLALKNDRKQEAELMFTKALKLDSHHAKSLEMLKALRQKGEQASGTTS